VNPSKCGKGSDDRLILPSTKRVGRINRLVDGRLLCLPVFVYLVAMGAHFQWQTDTEFGPEPEPEKPLRPSDAVTFWLAILVILLVLAAGWAISRQRLGQFQAARQADVQALLDLERQAFLAGDGDLFFSFLASDSAWRAAQLRPEQQTAWRAGYTVTGVDAQVDVIRANAAWSEAGQTYQRLLFFEERDGRLRHAATDPSFWGRPQTQTTNWGEVRYAEVDEQWIDSLAAFVDQVVAGLCAESCPPDRLPLTLVVADGYAETAVPHTLLIPSPRLLALDENGQPAAPFWQLLSSRLRAYLSPAVIRFALPPTGFLGLHTFDYERLAADFMAQHPDIQIELVTLERMPADYRELTPYDGAAFVPPVDMVAAGAVYDLSPLVDSDPQFAPGDFYEQIWQGGWWHERMWFLPQAAGMKVMFINKDFYNQAGLAEPSLRWTWQEMDADLAALVGPVGAVNSSLNYTVFLDVGPDTLLAYAYNWQTDCTETATVRCQTPLTAGRVAAALTWYRQLAGQPGMLPDGGQPVRYSRRWNWQAAVRVEEPVYYEHFLQMSALGVTTFPGSARFDGITPLWVDGSFITQSSRQPLAVWEWLKFLSYQAPLPRYRLIPARPSVAQRIAYWQTLPRALSEPLRAAFPFARPVLLDEKEYFGAERLTAVLSGRQTPQEVAHHTPPLRWFAPP